jgi:hypothetical protein
MTDPDQGPATGPTPDAAGRLPRAPREFADAFAEVFRGACHVHGRKAPDLGEEFRASLAGWIEQRDRDLGAGLTRAQVVAALDAFGVTPEAFDKALGALGAPLLPPASMDLGRIFGLPPLEPQARQVLRALEELGVALELDGATRAEVAAKIVARLRRYGAPALMREQTWSWFTATERADQVLADPARRLEILAELSAGVDELRERLEGARVRLRGADRQPWAHTTCALLRNAEELLGILSSHVLTGASCAAGRERDELERARIVIRGHADDCPLRRDWLGTASEDPGCTCGFDDAVDAPGMREVLAELHRAFQRRAEAGGLTLAAAGAVLEVHACTEDKHGDDVLDGSAWLELVARSRRMVEGQT